MLNILTVDVEDWYQSSLDVLGPPHANLPRPVPPSDRVVFNTGRLLKIFHEYGVKATFFVLGNVAEAYPDLVRQIRAEGHDIGTHGYGHELVYKLSPEVFRTDVERSMEILGGITGEQALGYRAPCFSITRDSEWALSILSKLGIRYDSSLFPIRRKLYGYPGCNRFPHRTMGDIFEFPVATTTIGGQNVPIGGGGYFRVTPYFFIQKAIEGINRRNRPVVFYLHPYELDVEELESPLDGETHRMRLMRLVQKAGRGKTEKKIRRLLSDFQWTSAREWLKDRMALQNSNREENRSFLEWKGTGGLSAYPPPLM